MHAFKVLGAMVVHHGMNLVYFYVISYPKIELDFLLPVLVSNGFGQLLPPYIRSTSRGARGA